MKKLVWIHCVVGLALLFGVGTSSSEPYRHPETGIIFPDYMAGVEKMKVTDFEREHPGLGVSVGYNGAGIAATIYLYNMRMTSVPENLDSPVLVSHFKQAIDAVFQAESQGLWRDVKKTSEDVITSGTGRKALCATLTYNLNNEDLLSKICMFAYKNHFVKIRFTYRKDIQIRGEDTFEKLFEALSELAEVPPPQSTPSR